ncbi:phage tail family protein [Paludicola sp. MB14-C6]|uniref:phage tail domain-containing protein n=1 Tax=Paludihabitans sp. MB14-C6 TaxID=3070656 RepID=UPI0027DC501A|nr:phage tail domain-containing protein [Paludicola sp. MB14-C6]WMJ23453.1 phage tail family protein [Paludicola sp. MB14-C6]
MKSLTYISDSGLMIQFNATFPFYVDHEDLNSVGASFDEIKPAGYDGTITTGGSYNKKIIPISGTIVGTSKDHISELENLLAMTMNIHYEGWLIAEQNSGKKKKIKCRPTQNPSFSKAFGLGVPFTCEWQCDKPYWLEYNDTIVPIGQIVPMWSFPFTPPVTFGRAVQNVDIMNHTSIEIPIRIEVLSQSTLIEIVNVSTGASFKITAQIEKNHKMIIDSDNCDVYIVDLVSLEQVDATNRLVPGSDYITLKPGNNRIEINNGIADSTPLSYIIYNIPSLAV